MAFIKQGRGKITKVTIKEEGVEIEIIEKDGKRKKTAVKDKK